MVLLALAMYCPSGSFAQNGALRGGNMMITNGTNTVTLQLPNSPTSYTFTLPQDSAIGIQYLYDDGTGKLSWGFPVDTTNNASTVLYNTDHAQVVGLPGTDLFNVGYSSGATGPAVGARVNSTANGPTGTSITGISDTARNVKTSNGFGTVGGLIDTVYNAGSGTQIGLQVSVTGGGNNYAAITSSGRVGIGTSLPSDSLEVAGNVRISGQNGLKITEGSNGTMGTGVLANVGGLAQVQINTTKVTATSRVILTAQDNGGNAANMGTPYVTARAAGNFTIQSTNNNDRSTVAWLIIEP
ncbi:MAG TPA: hypothetical protein VEW28_07455 [Candidatus Kapabacteria bacterium]|nr:hypothetical protein [Candidatus Kapabacteria bacterium]